YQGDETHGEDRGCVDPHAGGFLQRIASAPMKARVVLTSRLHPRELDGLAAALRRDLNALDPEDAVRFFHAQKIKGTRTEIQAACEPYGYHPLALRLLAGYILKDHRHPRDIKAAPRHPVEPNLKGRQNHILKVAYDAMKEPQRDLLSRIAAFRNPVSYET